MINATSRITIGAAAVGLAGIAAAQSTLVIQPRTVYVERPPGTVVIVESAKVAADSILLFRDRGFQDEAVLTSITATQAAGQAHDLPAGMEDSLSSLRWNLPAGVLVVLYEDDGAKGEQLALWGSGQIEALSEFDFNDKASQWAWYYVGGGHKPSEVVIRGTALPVGAVVVAAGTPVTQSTLQLFKSKNFEANTVTLNPLSQAANTLHRLPEDLPDSLTSMRWNLPPGVVVMFYQDADGGKQQVPIWGNGQVADLDIWDFNDKASRWAWYYIGSPDAEVVGYTPPPARDVVVVDADSIDVIAAAMKSNELEIDANDLRAKRNPTGAGTFVYAPQTRFNGVERRVIWIVIDGRPYAISGPAKMITPALASHTAAPELAWSSTGLSRTNAEDDAAKIVFAE